MTASTVPTTGPAELHERVISWFDEFARDLPWRTDPHPWRVMVSEFMLQQTPVERVIAVFEAWMLRWPTPQALAAASPGDAVRAWGKLGYPRRAQRLHAAAVAIVAEHDGAVPADVDALRALPGVGDYTAAAIASFAFAGRHVVLDTNVRRLFARVVDGVEAPPPSTSAAERDLAAHLLPDQSAHRWAAASMEFGAVVCTARSPRCGGCPIADLCVWNLAGRPGYTGPPRRGQPWAGTDRQVRGRLLDVLRDSIDPVAKSALDAAWDDDEQRERCLASLLADGLVSRRDDGRYAL